MGQDPTAKPPIARDFALRPASPLTKTEARRLTEKIKKQLDQIEAKADEVAQAVTEAFHSKAWAALTYASWAQYVDVEFRISRRRSYQLVAWADLNRELEAGGLPLVPTEREARAILAAKKNDADNPHQKGGGENLVHTSTPPEQPVRLATGRETASEEPSQLPAEPPVQRGGRVERATRNSGRETEQGSASNRRAGAIEATAHAVAEAKADPERAIAEAFAEPEQPARPDPTKTDLAVAMEALIECRLAEARKVDPDLWRRFASWTNQASAVRRADQTTAAPATAPVAKPKGKKAAATSDMKPSDCDHPVTRRLGNQCALCGATVGK